MPDMCRDYVVDKHPSTNDLCTFLKTIVLGLYYTIILSDTNMYIYYDLHTAVYDRCKFENPSGW